MIAPNFNTTFYVLCKDLRKEAADWSSKTNKKYWENVEKTLLQFNLVQDLGANLGATKRKKITAHTPAKLFHAPIFFTSALKPLFFSLCNWIHIYEWIKT